MDARSELALERSTFVKAEKDLREGEMRIALQEELVADFQEKGIDTREAERLLQLLRQTLLQWQQHHVLILQRIDYLEAKIADPGSAARSTVGRLTL